MLIIEHPLTGGKLQVANQDFTQQMTWEDAKRACSELGSGWRLPNIDELKAMYLQLYEKKQGSLKAADYWSSAEFDNDFSWHLYFRSGVSFFNEKYNTYYVRAVRSL